MSDDDPVSRAAELLASVGRDDEDVDVEELVALLESGRAPARRTAAEAVESTSEQEPAALVPVVADLADAADVEGGSIVAALANVATHDPGAVAPAAPVLRESLVDGTVAERRDAASGLGHLARADPDAVWPVREALLDAYDADFPRLRAGAAHALANLATDDPGALALALEPLLKPVADSHGAFEVEPADLVDTPILAVDDLDHPIVEPAERARGYAAVAVRELVRAEPASALDVAPTLIDLLDDEVGPVRAAAAGALGEAAGVDPDAVLPATTDLLAIVTEDASVPARQAAALTLATVAEHRPAEIAGPLAEATPDLLDALDAEDAETRAAAAGLLSYVAESHPDAVAPATDRLLALLAEDQPAPLRGSVALTLGYLGAEEAADRLRELADDETAPDVVRESAAEARSLLAERA